MISKLKLAHRILAGFALAMLLMASVGCSAYLATRDLGRRLEYTGGNQLVKIDSLWAIREAQSFATRGVSALMLWQLPPASREKARAMVRDGLVRLDAAVAQYEALPRSDESARVWGGVPPALDGWRRATERTLSAIADRERLAGSTDPAALADAERSAMAAFLGMRAAFEPVDGALTQLMTITREHVNRDRAEASEATARTGAVIVTGLLVSAAVLVAVALLLGRRISASVAALVASAGKLRDAVARGELDVRGDVAAIEPEFRPVIAGMNETADAYTRPIRVTADYVTRISRGAVPPKITDRYEGEFEATKEALNHCIDAVGALVADARTLAGAGVEGRLRVRADPARHEGEFRAVVQGMNDTLDAVVAPLTTAARYLDELAKGTVPPLIADAGAYRGDFAPVRENLNALVGTISALRGGLATLMAQHTAGDTEAVTDEARFPGVFRELAGGFNGCIQMYVLIVRDLLAILNRYADGDFEPLLRKLPGKQSRANVALEKLRTNLRDVSAEVQRLVEAARGGRLDARAEAGRFGGDWAKLVAGLNATIDELLLPVGEAAQVLERLAARDLRARMSGAYVGDHARIKESVNSTAAALDDALAQVASAVEQVSSAAAQIAASSQAVASGASEQASALEETSTSIDSVGGMARATADNAQQAAALVVSTRAAATGGSTAVEQMQGAMVKIKASAEGTSQIIKDVSDIAFQTNLLALNAAVEAARAGEAGRGFAVVAEEVRSLALRAKEAATKTEELIRGSVKQAVEGELAARHVTARLGEIVDGVGKVSAIVEEIAASAREQAGGIDQVTKAIGEMDKVTQQNAASAEESSSAASELSGQAEELAAMVGAFQLDRVPAGGPRGHRAATPSARRAGPAASARLSAGAHAARSDDP